MVTDQTTITPASSPTDITKNTASRLKSLLPSTRRQLILYIALGVIIITAILIVTTVITRTTTPVATMSGTVTDTDGQPIDGALVSSAFETVATLPNGQYTIQSKSSNTLQASAFGYITQQVTAPENIVLQSASTGTTYVNVIGSDSRPLAGALITRLNPNNAAPVEQQQTDESGLATFSDIPSGMTSFIVQYPNLNPGWAQTALDPGSTARIVVDLNDEKRTLSQSLPLIKPAQAQESQGRAAQAEGTA